MLNQHTHSFLSVSLPNLQKSDSKQTFDSSRFGLFEGEISIWFLAAAVLSWELLFHEQVMHSSVFSLSFGILSFFKRGVQHSIPCRLIFTIWPRETLPARVQFCSSAKRSNVKPRLGQMMPHAESAHTLAAC